MSQVQAAALIQRAMLKRSQVRFALIERCSVLPVTLILIYEGCSEWVVSVSKESSRPVLLWKHKKCRAL